MPDGRSISFRLAPHAIYGVEVVEILLNGEVCAALYPAEDGMVRVISAHFAGDLYGPSLPAGIVYETGEGTVPPIPELQLQFAPQPYTLVSGKVHRF